MDSFQHHTYAWAVLVGGAEPGRTYTNDNRTSSEYRRASAARLSIV